MLVVGSHGLLYPVVLYLCFCGHLDCCFEAKVVDHSKHRCVSKTDVELLEWCKCIVANRIQDELLAGLFDAKVVVVALL